ncbi:hypothetical protein BKA70DRAFT_1419213 [Coprinopsis sp. MPI-PUGE-AT-0042]|nr:hypothetical protein BKA70DRAFT_1419213 [Coprinopsis sp. MPI-PUGE-AT-0042]
MDCATPAPAILSHPQLYSTASIASFVHTRPESPSRSSQSSPSQRSKMGRKTWKSLKEKKEAVWPDFLEEALLEALERYRPTSSKDPRLLRRFPKRNAFISNYIKQQTGCSRTPKQVGSRLQQLRETCTDARVIRLISSRDFDAPDRAALNAHKAAPYPRINTSSVPQIPTVVSAPSPEVAELGLTPTLSIESLTLVDPYDYPLAAFADEINQCTSRRQQVAALATNNSWPHAYVHLDLVSTGEQYTAASQDCVTSFTLDLDESGLTDSPVLTGPDAWKWQRRISVQPALPLCYYVPNVMVSSSILSSEVRYKSLFRVQKEHKILFEESTELECVSDGSSRPSLFRTSLVPQSWGSISTKVSDLRQVVVIQDIYEVPHGAERSADPIYSVIYSFYASCSLEHSAVESPYFPTLHPSPLHDERIPLAPILTNPTYSPELLNYDYHTGEISLLPALSASSSSAASPSVPVDQLHPTPITQWMNPVYVSNNYYPAASYSALSGQEPCGGYLETEQLPSYSSLYPF